MGYISILAISNLNIEFNFYKNIILGGVTTHDKGLPLQNNFDSGYPKVLPL